MSHPRVEEVSDSDLSDPSEGDIDDFIESDILRQRAPPPAGPHGQGSSIPQRQPGFAPVPVMQNSPVPPKSIISSQILYPIYFDAARTRAEGRRVSSSLAVKNPLAAQIARACADLRLQPVLEQTKTHPQDWANPGRVRINLKDASNPFIQQVKNKHHLFIMVAEQLKKRGPVTDETEALRWTGGQGLKMPEQGEKWPRPAVPKAWKLNEFLPLYSDAMTGGGVTENMNAFRDAMREYGSGAGGGMGMESMLNMMGGAGGGGPSGHGHTQGGAGEQGGGGKKHKKGKGKA